MKKLTLLAAALFTIMSGQAQKSKVIVDSLDTKAKIYSKTLIWITNNWKNAGEVIQLQDVESGTIIVKCNLATTNSNRDISKTQITFNVKDGKAKIAFENTILWNPGFTKTYENPTKWYMKWKEQVGAEIDSLIVDYEKALLKTDDF